MKLLLDTNVLIDIVARREPFFEDSRSVYALCVIGEYSGLVTDLTICNLAYILRKQLSVAQMRKCLENITSRLGVIPLGGKVISEAIHDFVVDFEDMVQYKAGAAADVDCIVTRNARHFPLSSIRVCSPSEFLDGIG